MIDGDNLLIREIEVTEAEALAELAARTYFDTFAAVNTPENMEAYLSAAFSMDQIASELRDPHSTFLMAELDGRNVGYAKLLRNGDVPECVPPEKAIELVRLYVDKDVQGAGAGAALMRYCMERAKNEGFRNIFLGVWEHNARAQAFYRKWDFARVGEHIFQMGDDPQIDWWMMRGI